MQLDLDDMNAVQVHALIEERARVAVRPEVRDVRDTLLPGKAVRQGDVYLVRVGGPAVEGLHDVMRQEIDSRQLVDGTSAGSRHVVSGAARVYRGPLNRTTLPICVRETALLGPVVVARGEFLVTHPEHAHVRCPAGVYQVVHQVDAATRQRVQD